MSTIENARPFFPSFDDYKGAMTAIIRLQDTYHLRADSLADGVLPGIRRSASLSINDMFELGRHAYELKDWFHTKGWMEACLKKMGNVNVKDGIRRFDVLDHIAFSEYNVGDSIKLFANDILVLGISINILDLMWYNIMIK